MGVGSTTVGVTVNEEKKKPPSPTLSQSVQRRRSWWESEVLFLGSYEFNSGGSGGGRFAYFCLLDMA